MKRKTLALLMAVPLMGGMAPPPTSLPGRLASELGRHDLAIRMLNKQEDPWSRLWLAHSYSQTGQGEQAIQLWQTLAADPQVGKAAEEELAQCKNSLQTLSRLLEDYQALLEGEPSKADWQALEDRLNSYAREEGGSRNALRARLVQADILARTNQDPLPILRELAGKSGLLGEWAQLRMVEAGELSPLPALVAKKSPFAPAAMLCGDRTMLERLSHLDVPEAEEATFRLAEEERTLARYRAYLTRFPQGAHSPEVLKKLASFNLSPAERATVGYRLYKQRDYGKAIRLLQGLPGSRYWYARSLWFSGDLKGAEAAVRPLVNDPTWKKRALITLGQILADAKAPGAAACFRQAADTPGDESLTRDALSLLARDFRRRDQDNEALIVDREIIDRFPRSEEAANSYWKTFWESYRKGKPDPSMLQRLVTLFPRSNNGARAAYWLGKLSGEESYYRKAIDWAPTDFYGFRAKQVLSNSENPFDTGNFRPTTPVHPAWGKGLSREEAALLPADGIPLEVGKWGELFFLRQYRAVRAQNERLQGWLKHLQGRYPEAIKQGEDRFLSYPLGYRPFLEEASGKKNLNPLLLAALVREESRYDPMAVSWVGATGLAQLMPSTAKGIDKQLGELGQRPLTDPRSNLHRGAWYLAFSRSCFPGMDHLAVAGYNAGTGAVKEWKGRFSSLLGDPDAFIEAIPYLETRFYVKKVFASYWNYAELYGTAP